MKEQELLTHRLQLTALSIESRIQRILDALHELRRVTLVLFECESAGSKELAEWLAEEHYAEDESGFFRDQQTLARVRSGEQLPEAYSVSWNCRLCDTEDLRRRLFALRRIGPYLKQLSQRLPGTAWVYYQDAANASLQYPFIDVSEAIPADFDWLSYHTMRSVAPEVNVEREIRWTAPTIDYAGEGLIISASIPLYHGDTFIGCWSMDLPLQGIEEEILRGHVLPGQESFVVDADGLLLMHERVRERIDPVEGSVIREHMSMLGGGFEHIDLADPALSSSICLELSDGRGRELLASAMRIPAMQWTLFTTIPRSVLDESMRRRLTDALQDVKQGRLGRRIAQQEMGADWHDVAQAFNEMTAALEEALMDARRSSERYQTLAENSLDLIWLMDESGVFTYVNPAIEGMLGYQPQEWVGSRWKDRADASARHWMNCLLDSRDTGTAEVMQGVTALKHRDGQWIQVESVCRVLHDNEGRPSRILCIGRDISERLRSEQELARLESQLRQAQKMEAIGQLAGGVAHDFNNILQAIQGYGVLVRDSLQPHSLEHGYMTELLRSVERAAALTRQLLAFGRRQTLNTEHLDLRDVVRDALRMIQRVLGEDVMLQFKQIEQQLVIHADRGQLEQVLVNLCLNARDAMPAGGHLEINVGRESFSPSFCEQHPWAIPGDHVFLRVSDTGCGMSEKVLRQIFEPFFTTKEIGRGTGLGLAMVYGIVRQHNGFVHVDSTEGRGSIFSIYLPLSEGQISKRKNASDEAVTHGTGERLLVVEDERTVRKLTVMALQSAGYLVESAISGDDALELLSRDTNFELLLTDVVMPGMSGHALAQSFLDYCPKSRVLFMSGFNPGSMDHPLHQQANCGFLQKPFPVSSLLSAVARLLQDARALTATHAQNPSEQAQEGSTLL